ncbi:MAG TPA: hypothetical protein VM733_17735 [Thermoanaerobaculia bacterium]|nr:hypothetical protein [Thermoanaerobaculia bacterium]
MSRFTPRVFVLTDGSGRTTIPRTHYSEQLVARAGATHGGIFGRHRDAAVYRALLDGDAAVFVALTTELARAFSHAPPPYVVHDALEGYNPVHDLCRWLTGAALCMAGQPDTPQFEFSTAGRALGTDDMRIDLDADAVNRKLEAAMEYPPLAHELRQKLDEHGTDFLRTETFTRVRRWDEPALFDGPPQYEQFAADRVAAGVYAEAIRFREHVLPLLETFAAESRVPLAVPA